MAAIYGRQQTLFYIAEQYFDQLADRPDTVVTDALAGLAAAHSSLSVDLENRVVLRAAGPTAGQVGAGVLHIVKNYTGDVLTVGAEPGTRVQPDSRAQPGSRARPVTTGPFAAAAHPAGPVTTQDGRAVTVLCNVASAVETRRGLAAGAVLDAGRDTRLAVLVPMGALAWRGRPGARGPGGDGRQARDGPAAPWHHGGAGGDGR
jgi:dihydroxyacetone kinase